MARLTAKTRNALPGSVFALPGRRFPVHDKAHARVAKSYASRMAKRGQLSPSQKAAVFAKANRKLGLRAATGGAVARLARLVSNRRRGMDRFLGTQKPAQPKPSPAPERREQRGTIARGVLDEPSYAAGGKIISAAAKRMRGRLKEAETYGRGHQPTVNRRTAIGGIEVDNDALYRDTPGAIARQRARLKENQALRNRTLRDEAKKAKRERVSPWADEDMPFAYGGPVDYRKWKIRRGKGKITPNDPPEEMYRGGGLRR